MTPKEQLLCFITADDRPVDPIRIMKGLFVFTKSVEAGELPALSELFEFRPMGYGPCALDAYDALEALVDEGLVARRPVSGETWSTYIPTDKGKAAAAEVAKRAPDEIVEFLRQLREWCDKQSFTSLLRRIYHKWPEYAAKSVLPHLRPNG